MNELTPMDKVDIVIQDALDNDNPDIAFQQIKELEDAKELIESIKSKFFFRLTEVWDHFTISKTESLHAHAYGAGYHPHTIDRYVTMWKYQEVLPETIQERPVREKFVITKMLSQGYELDEDDWEELERTSSKAELDAKVRDIKGEAPRKGSLQIYLDSDGTLYGWMNNEMKDIGYLDVTGEHDIIQKAVKRIIDNAGVLRK